MATNLRGNRFEAAFMNSGRRLSKSFATAVEAATWEDWARVELAAGRPVHTGRGASETFNPAATMAGLVGYVSDNRWAGKKAAGDLIRNATLFQAFVGANTPPRAALTTDNVNRYRRSMVANKRSNATVNRHLSAISVLAKYARNLDALDKLPLIEWQKEGPGRLRFLSEDEEAALLKHIRFLGREDDAAFYEFLLDTGARLGEALKVRWADIPKDLSRVTFVDTKNGSNRTVPLTGRVQAGLRALKAGAAGKLAGPFAEFSKGGQTSFWRRLQTRLPFLADCVPHHVFRHTTASRLVGRGVDLYRVKKWMGHASITTTERYAHLAEDHMAELAAALERPAGRALEAAE